MGVNGLHGKALISQIQSLRRAVIPSKWLRPWVYKTSFSSVKATPTCTPHQSDLQEDQGEDPIEAHSEVHSAMPERTGVAVEIGPYIGQPLIIGMQFKACKPCLSLLANDNLCIGIEAVGCVGSGRMMSISFAPFSGRCFIEHENGFTFQTKALPSIRGVSEGRAWIHVTERGGIRFLLLY